MKEEDWSDILSGHSLRLGWFWEEIQLVSGLAVSVSVFFGSDICKEAILREILTLSAITAPAGFYAFRFLIP